MENLKGDWVAKVDVPTQMGFSVFTIPKGAIVAVKQVDKNNRKILVEASPQFIDWMHKNFLNLFEQIDQQ